MRSFIFLITILTTLTSVGATKYLQGDGVKNSALTKTYTFSGTQGVIPTLQSVSGDMTAAASGDYSMFTLQTVPVSKGGTGLTTFGAKGAIPVATAAGTLAALPVSSDRTYLMASSDSTQGVVWKSFVRPTVQKFNSGSGTYTTPSGVSYIRVIMVGGGGSPTVSGVGAGNTGGSSTFGSSLLTAAGGAGSSTALGAAGGAATINSPAIEVIKVSGGGGGSGGPSANDTGGFGGSSALGGGGIGGASGVSAGTSGEANTGGGGGGNANAGGAGSGGGGAGAYLEAIIHSPSATYSYAVGAGGAANAGGSAGGSGVIIVTEHYQ